MIPRQGAKIPHAFGAKKSKHKKNRQYYNKFSKDLKIVHTKKYLLEWIKKLWYTYTMEYYSAIKRNAFESIWPPDVKK